MSKFQTINRLIETLGETAPTPDPLSLEDLAQEPLVQFAQWLESAVQAGHPQANAVCLSTADASGRPSARMVLLKELTPEGFVFYTNTQSRKGLELAQNPRAALLFYWETVRRQVRVVGKTTQVSRARALKYFRSRHPDSQLGAWASPQSQVVNNRLQLDNMLAQVEQEFADQSPPYPLPPHWGGYCLAPTEFEFWQHRHNRLHDRFQYTKGDNGGWIRRRLAP